MAERRMFSKTIVDSDAFLDMPMSTQCLYFHLNMRADDDGFVNNPKRIQRMVGAADDDLKLLIAKSFILTFESGVIVIKHWRMNNYLRNDRYKPTAYQDEKNQLILKENNAYSYIDNDVGIPMVNQMPTNGKPSIGKVSIGKVSIDKDIIYIVEQIINYLNSKTGKSFKKNVKKNQAVIKARLKEGYQLDDFYKVIDKKTKDWLNNPDMNRYLRPETLFGPKFEGYLNESINYNNQSCIGEVLG